jgi:4-amino-4-deoxy-L-arabinose transferase-like glycosyltransferase
LDLSSRRHIAAILFVASLVVLPGLGRATLWEPDEPRFAEATRQMFERGDFLTPYLNGSPRYEKPILFYWLQAASTEIFGSNELAVRVPSALAGIGAVLLLYLLGCEVASPRAALFAAFSLATMFRFVVFARLGLTDMPVVFFVVAALYGFVRASQRGSPAWAFIGWLCVGLGVLTKGPVGLLPIAVWVVYAPLSGGRSALSSIRPLSGVALAAAISLPWYVAMIVQHGRAFVDFAIGHEMVERAFVEGSFEPPRSVFYYLKVWPGDAAPWSLLFIAGAVWVWRRWSRFDAATKRAFMFSVIWFGCVFLVFSLVRSKVVHYVLPAYPAAALFIGVFVERLDELAPNAGRRVVAAVYSIAFTLALAYALIGILVVPRAIEPFKPMAVLGREAGRQATDDVPIGLLGRYGFSSLVYYSHHNVRLLDDGDAAVDFLSRHGSALCVMLASDFEQLAPRLDGVEILARGEEFNVRIERLMERRRTPGREWVLVRRSEAAATSGRRPV